MSLELNRTNRCVVTLSKEYLLPYAIKTQIVKDVLEIYKCVEAYNRMSRHNDICMQHVNKPLE